MVTLKYSPTNIDLIEQGEIIFETHQIGKWNYILSG